MKQVLSKLVVTTLGLLLATSANAIVINEYFAGIETAEFTVNNNSEQDIYIFAVGTNAATYADYIAPAGAADLGWDGVVLSAETWDSGYSIYLGRDIYADTSTMGLGGLLGSSSSFDSLFAGYSSAILFSVNVDPEGNAPIAAGSTAAGFTFYTTELASPFATYGDFGGLIETGVTIEAAPAVPVPAAVWLFGSGLIGLVGVARRKQR